MSTNAKKLNNEKDDLNGMSSVPLNLSDVNFNHLYYFHVIACAGSLSKAKEEIGVAQSTLSEQLKQLESKFATKLFHRRSSGLELNEAGRRVFRYTKVMFRTGQRLLHAFQNGTTEGEKMVLEVGVASSISRSFASDYFLPIFEERSIHVRLKHGDYEYLLNDLATYQLDLLISDRRPSVGPRSGVVCETIHQTPLVFVAATARHTNGHSNGNAHSWNGHNGNGHNGNDGSALPLLNYGVGSPYRWEVDKFLAEKGWIYEVIGEVDDVLTLRAAVEKGVCAAALPETVVAEHVATGEFTVLGKVGAANIGVFASYHKKDPSSAVLDIVRRLRARRSVPSSQETDSEEAMAT